jgi:CheY-like chemotaxis protein
MAATRILIADTAEAMGICRPCLTGPFELVHVERLEQAVQALAGEVDIVLCGVHFDEGRMYDLLRHMKRAPALAQLPFVAMRCLEGELVFDGTLRESVKIAVAALGGNAFVDLLGWRRALGVAEAGRRLTQLLQQLPHDPYPDTDEPA